MADESGSKATASETENATCIQPVINVDDGIPIPKRNSGRPSGSKSRARDKGDELAEGIAIAYVRDYGVKPTKAAYIAALIVEQTLCTDERGLPDPTSVEIPTVNELDVHIRSRAERVRKRLARSRRRQEQ